MVSRNPLSHFPFHCGVLRIVCEVVPLPAIIVVIVKLFRSVRVGDVAVAFRLKSVVFVAENREGGFVPGGFRDSSSGRSGPSLPAAHPAVHSRSARRASDRCRADSPACHWSILVSSLRGPPRRRLTRVARSQSEYFPQRPFSPRWKPWSLHKTIMVLSAYFDFSSAADQLADQVIHHGRTRQVSLDGRLPLTHCPDPFLAKGYVPSSHEPRARHPGHLPGSLPAI